MRSVSGTRMVYAPILLGVAFIVTLFIVAESGHARLRDSAGAIAAAQERQALLSRYLRLVLDAETAQRGFLLTEDPRYLRQFDPAVRSLEPLLDRIIESLEQSDLREDVAKAQMVRKTTGEKIGEMRTTLRLYAEKDRTAALALFNTDFGEKSMVEMRHQIREIYDNDVNRVIAARAAWMKDLRSTRVLLAAASILSLLLVVLLGAMFAQDVRRREYESEELNRRNRELDRTVQQRTSMLFHLSSSLQKVAEREKAALARELHDELGGLLVATKYDVSWLRRQLGDGSEAIKLRWERVLHSMDEGLTLKRRIIESLRPTLLDNVGLVAALRWLVEESCRRTGIACDDHYEEPLPELSADARIAVFRVVQECLTNILKHAQAKSVKVSVTASDKKLSVKVIDDGVGIDERHIETPNSHGLLGMRHRIESLEGSLTVRSLGPRVGTEVSFTLPLERIRDTGT
ncbi:MAG: CHASE3 domain-containing protein [Steroidobacteraceae bacterium]